MRPDPLHGWHLGADHVPEPGAQASGSPFNRALAGKGNSSLGCPPYLVEPSLKTFTRVNESPAQLRNIILGLLICTAVMSPAFAQVNAVASSVSDKVDGFVTIVQGVGLGFFTLAMCFVAYKFALIEGTKLTDLKGVLIGGTLFGAAGAIATYFSS